MKLAKTDLLRDFKNVLGKKEISRKDYEYFLGLLETNLKDKVRSRSTLIITNFEDATVDDYSMLPDVEYKE